MEQKGTEAQEAANWNNSKTLYCIINELTGRRINSSAHIKDKNGKLLIIQEEQKQRWVEHFQETLNHPHPNVTNDFKVEAVSAQEELQINTSVIAIEEVKTVIKSLKNNKAAGLDKISVELLKYGGESMACW